MEWCKHLILKVQDFIGTYLYPAIANVIDPSKDNLEEQSCIAEIILQLVVSEKGYYRVLSISKDDDFSLRLIRPLIHVL